MNYGIVSMNGDNIVYFVYLTINKINGKMYIGQHHCKYDEQFTDGYLGSGIRLKRAVKKYGAENFERIILEYADNPEELNKLEEKYVDAEVLNNKMFYNLRTGGNQHLIASEETRIKIGNSSRGRKGYWSGKKMSVEACQKMSVSKKGKYVGENNPKFGTHLSEDTKRKISMALKGRKGTTTGTHLSDETKRKISESRKGTHLSEEHKQKLSDLLKGREPWIKGKKHTEESKKKMSDSLKGRTLSEEHKNKIREAKLHQSEETRRKNSEGRKAYWARIKAMKLNEQQNDNILNVEDKQ